MPTEQLLVTLRMNASQYNREARGAATATGSIGAQAKTAATATGGLRTQMAGFGTVLRGAAVAGGIIALGRGLQSAVLAAEEAASIMAVTKQIIADTGGVANVTADDMSNLTRQLSSLTGIQDEVIQQGANVLLSFKKVRNEVGEGNDVFDRAAELMLDVSTVMGGDASGAATQLGKALEDPVRGMTALRRAGLTFTKQQEDQIKALVESGDLLAAQKLLLSELEAQLGGTATAGAQASERLGTAFGEIGESIGVGLLPIIEDLADGVAILAGMSPQVVGLADTLKEIGEVNLSDMFQVGEVLGITDFRDTMVEILETADLTDAELRELASGGIAQLREEFDLTESRARILAEVIDEQLNPPADEFGHILGQVADAAGDAAGEVGGLGDEAEETGEQAETAEEKMRGLRDAYLALADPVFAASSALDGYRDAQANLAEVQADGESDAREIAEAQLAVAAAALEAEGALSELADGDLNAGIGLIADALNVSDSEARDLLVTLGLLDGQHVTAIVTTDYRTRGTPPSRVIQTQFGNVTLRQHGGPVTGRTPYVVGERGPELFIPNGSGQVVSNQDLMRLMSAVGTQNTYNIPVQSSGNVNTDAQLVGAIHSVLRRMETL